MITRTVALLSASAGSLALVAGCGVLGANDGPLDGALVTREDGSSFEVSDLSVRCGPDDQFPGEVVLIVASPRSAAQGMQLVVVPSLVAADTEVTLPAYATESGVSLFIYDRETGDEANSGAEDSSGSITIDTASCDPAPLIEMRFDAVLGSELFGLDPLDVLGEISLAG
jgi:hypothetical protein